MNTFINSIIFITVLFAACITINAQKKTVLIDSVVISGIYKVILLNNSEFIGEVINKDSINIKFNISGYSNIVRKSNIRQIEIPDKFSIKINNDKKFKNLFILNAGYSFPSGGADEMQKPGPCIHAAVYHMFDIVFGIGPEISFNYFPGKSSVSYYSEKLEAGSISFIKLNANFIAGNFKPGNKLLFYGLIGVGLSYFNEGDSKVTYSDPYYYNTYLYKGSSSLNFHYGAGAGFSYMLNKGFGINAELQFNNLSSSNPYSFNSYNNGINGYFSFKLGCVFTK